MQRFYFQISLYSQVSGVGNTTYLSRGLNSTHNSLKICKANIEGTKTKKLQKDEAKINVDDINIPFVTDKNKKTGLPWWSSG